MCGIAGLYYLCGKPVPLRYLEQMNQRLKHRGPDDSGFFISENLGLVHRRLSILDLSSAGHQPMHSQDGRYTVTYNGEVYNYLELKQELIEQGYCFKTETDTEVILAAYLIYGIECLKKFNGMWAIAIWDEKEKVLFCARDRFGIKPFYYSVGHDFFAFASEIKSLLVLPEISREVNQRACYRFLRFGEVYFEEQTFFSEICSLPPAHFMRISPDGVVKEQYWSLPSDIQSSDIPMNDSIQIFKDLLTDSVRLRLRSDVPVGSCLSGGLDSSSIVALMHGLLKETESTAPVHVFSACYVDKRFDERDFIQQLLNQYSLQEHYLFPEPQVLEQDLPALVQMQDEPFGSLSIFAQWCVMRKASESGIKVLLDGQGSDEMLAGYGYDSFFWAELLRKGHFRTLFSEWKSVAGSTDIASFTRRLMRMLAPELATSWLGRKSVASNLFQSDFIDAWHQSDGLKSGSYSGGVLRQELKQEFQTRLPALLRYEDRNSMAFSLESRVPFLDHRLVEFAFSLPDEALIHQGWSKWILRQSMQGILPESIQWRKDKMGFVTPQELWFKQELRPFIMELLLSSDFQSRSYWHNRSILEAYEAYVENNNPMILPWLWRILSLELWLKWVVKQ